MAHKVFHYFKLFFLLLKINLLKNLEYRVDFFTTILPTGIYTAGYLVFLQVILSKVPSIAGWNFDRMLLLFVVEQIGWYLTWFSYRSSFDYFLDSVRSGQFDHLVKLPVSARFLASCHNFSLDGIFPMLVAVLIFIYSAQKLSVTFGATVCGFVLAALGFFVIYNIMFTAVSFAFWTIEGADIVDVFDEWSSFARYPKDVFPGPIAFILLTIFPALMVAYVPTTALLGFLDWNLVMVLIVVCVGTWAVSQKVWQAGLKHYSSASS